MKYRKAIVATLLLAGAVGKALVDGHVSPDEWGQIAAAGATAVGVWAVPNKQAPKV